MPLSTRDYAELTEELQDIFNETSSSAISESVGLNKVFKVKDTEILNYEHQILHGMSGIEQVPEGADLPRINSEEGDNITWSQVYYGAIAGITKKMRKFDMYDKMTGLVQSLTQDAWDKIDQSLADVLIQGGSTSYTDVYGETVASTGPDGLALFSAVHSNGTTSTVESNVISDSNDTANVVLSRDAIVTTIKDGLVRKDPNGLVRPIHFDTLLVPPSLTDQAMRFVFSEQISGAANWDPNMHVKGTIKEVVTWPRLETAGDATDGGAMWYLYDSKKVGESLNCLFSERPMLDSPEIVYENKDWEYSLDYFYTIGRGLPVYVRKSAGTA